jgi:hypothetical protein
VKGFNTTTPIYNRDFVMVINEDGGLDLLVRCKIKPVLRQLLVVQLQYLRSSVKNDSNRRLLLPDGIQ